MNKQCCLECPSNAKNFTIYPIYVLRLTYNMMPFCNSP